MARYRNRMVHFYDDITPLELYGILTESGGTWRRSSPPSGWLTAHPEACEDEL